MKLITYLVALAAVSLLLAGCASNIAGNEPQTFSLEGIHGKVMGGEQPIQGANIYYYAAGTTGYASTNTNILTTPVVTGSMAALFLQANILPAPPGSRCTSCLRVETQARARMPTKAPWRRWAIAPISTRLPTS